MGKSRFLGVRFGMVFQVEGLDLEAMKQELSRYGEINDVIDSEVVGDNGEVTPVKIIVIDSNAVMVGFVRARYNCVSHPKYPYLLYPMMDEEEKRKAEEMFGAV